MNAEVVLGAGAFSGIGATTVRWLVLAADLVAAMDELPVPAQPDQNDVQVLPLVVDVCDRSALGAAVVADVSPLWDAPAADLDLMWDVEPVAGNELLRRVLDPNEVSAAVAFRCSRETAVLHGSVVHTDGGFTP